MRRGRNRPTAFDGLFTTPGGLALVLFLLILVGLAAGLWLHLIPAPAFVAVA